MVQPIGKSNASVQGIHKLTISLVLLLLTLVMSLSMAHEEYSFLPSKDVMSKISFVSSRYVPDSLQENQYSSTGPRTKLDRMVHLRYLQSLSLGTIEQSASAEADCMECDHRRKGDEEHNSNDRDSNDRDSNDRDSNDRDSNDRDNHDKGDKANSKDGKARRIMGVTLPWFIVIVVAIVAVPIVIVLALAIWLYRRNAAHRVAGQPIIQGNDVSTGYTTNNAENSLMKVRSNGEVELSRGISQVQMD